MNINKISVLLFTSLVFVLGNIHIAEGAPLDVSKESKRLGSHFKGVRVYYSNFGGIDPNPEDEKTYDPPLEKLLTVSGAIIVPITQARFDDVQISYYWYRWFLWVSISKKGKVLFKHEYKYADFYLGDRSAVLESMFIRDLESEDVF